MIRRILRSLAALVVLGALLGGVPWALVRFVGSPVPTHPGGVGAVIDEIGRGGFGAGAVIRILAVIVWVAWLRLALAVLVELAAAVLRRPVPRIGLLGASQSWASALVGSAGLLSSVVGMAGGAGASPFGHLPAIGPRPVHLAFSADGAGPLGDVAPSVPDGATRADTTTTPSAPATWTVVRNDSLWRIAERALGDGMRWREILALNLGREVGPGVVMRDPDQPIQPGWVLRLPGDAPSGPVLARAGGRELTVERGDTLGRISERVYGDAGEWRVLWDANRGSVHGGTTFDDPNLILPGWTLVVPDDPAEPLPGASAWSAPGGDPAQDVVAEAGDEGDADCALPSAVAVPTISADGAPPGAPTAGIPAAGIPADAPGPVDERPAAGTDASATALASASSADVSTLRSDGFASESTIGIGLAGLLATGGIGLVASRRRRALRASPLHTRLAAAPRDPEAGALERTLRAVAADERVARIDLAVRAAVAAIGDGHLIGVLAEADGDLQMLVDGAPAAPPPPFLATAADRWVVPASTPTAEIPPGARFAPFPCPAIVQLGRCGDADLYVDLEALGVLAVDGPPRQARGIVGACLATLAVSPFGSGVRLATVGVDPAVTAASPGASHPVDADAAIELAAGHLAALFDVLPVGTPAATLRAASAGEPWEPIVVGLGAGAVGRAVGKELTDIAARPGRGIAVVTDAAQVDVPWRLEHDRDGWLLAPIGLRIVPLAIDPATATTLARLVGEPVPCTVAGPTGNSVGAASPRAPELDELTDRVAGLDAAAGHGAPDNNEPARVEPPRAAAERYADPEWALLVRTFGPPQVVARDGTVAGFARSKSLELVAWLTRHRRTATRSGARAALWEVEVANGTFANVVSDARQSLANAADPTGGEEWLGRTMTEQLLLHPLVRSDAEVLAGRLEAARHRSSEEAREILFGGLDLLAGVPFDASGYLWPDAEGFVAADTLLATTYAGELAELCLDAGDLDGVFRATGAGLVVLPGHEELLALRMRAHAAGGDLAAVRQEWLGYERILAADVFGDGEPSPRLVRLRTELLGTPRRSLTGSG